MATIRFIKTVGGAYFTIDNGSRFDLTNKAVSVANSSGVITVRVEDREHPFKVANHTFVINGVTVSGASNIKASLDSFLGLPFFSSYVFIIDQFANGTISAVGIYNSTGLTLTPTANGTGSFIITFPSALNQEKIGVFFGGVSSVTPVVFFNAGISDESIVFTAFDETSTAINEGFVSTRIEV